MYRWSEPQRQWHIEVEFRVQGERVRWFRRVPRTIGRDQEAAVREMAARFKADADALKPEIVQNIIRDREEERARRILAVSGGYIYALENDAFPGLLKVGKTKGDPHKRARDLSTGAPARFRVVLAEPVEYVDRAERIVHGTLKANRVNAAREFFKVGLEDVRAAVAQYRNRLFI